MPTSIGALIWWGCAVLLGIAGWLFVRVYDDVKDQIKLLREDHKQLEGRVETIEDKIDDKLEKILKLVS